MATLKHNGTEMARFQRETMTQLGGTAYTTISIGSSGWILRKHKHVWPDTEAAGYVTNTPWKRWKKISRDVEIQQVIDAFEKSEHWTRIS